MKPNRLPAQFELVPLAKDNPDRPDQRRFDQGLFDQGLRSRCDRPHPAESHLWAKVHLGARVRGLLAYLIGSTDLRVRATCDRHGNSLLIAYDPVSQQRHIFSSEQALREWADQRYYS